MYLPTLSLETNPDNYTFSLVTYKWPRSEMIHGYEKIELADDRLSFQKVIFPNSKQTENPFRLIQNTFDFNLAAKKEPLFFHVPRERYDDTLPFFN